MAGGGRHIAVIAPPLTGHYRPLGVLAAELAVRGHRVTFVHMADARPLVGGGAGFHAVGDGRFGAGALAVYGRRLGRAGGPLGLPAMIRASAAITAMLLDDLPPALELIGAEAVLAESAEPAGALVARRLGLPFVTSHTGLPLNRERGVPPPFVGWAYREGECAARRNDGGYRVADWLLRPITRATAHAAGRWGLDPDADGGMSPLLQVAQCVRGLDFPRAELPESFRYCGPFRAADPEPAPALPDDGPLVFCSLGSLQGDRARAFAAMARACAELGARAVVGHGGLLSARAAARIGHGALVRPFWPQEAVLARSAAAVLHGGFNTVADALAAGVPMVVSPIAFEQPATAARVARAGAGRVLRRLTRGGLADELGRVLGEPGYRAAAGRLAAETRAAGGARLAAELIDRALRTGRTPDRA